LEVLSAAARAVSTPIFAVGGVDSRERARLAREAGAHGVAAIRAIVGSEDPEDGARMLG
jgi:thiamine-phosphate pyrophosphorylase